jgi:hypothetical protein
MTGIVDGNGTIANHVMGEIGFEITLGRAANFVVQVMGKVSLLNFLMVKELFVGLSGV